MKPLEGPFEYQSWDSFPNDRPMPPLLPYSMRMRNGDVIKVEPMNPDNHTVKAPFVYSPALFYSLPKILDEADSCVESTSNNPVAISSRQIGKTMVYSKKGVINNLQLPDFTGQEVKGDIVEVTVRHDDRTGENYTTHYDVKFDSDL